MTSVNMGITWEELFPWIPWLQKSLEPLAYPLWVISITLAFVFLIPLVILLVGYEPQIFPRPKIVKYRYKWDARSVAIVGIMAAVYIIFYSVGYGIQVIPGIMTMNVVGYAFLFLFPVFFGWPGIWAVVVGEILGAIMMGWMMPAYVICYFSYDLVLGWWAWKIFGRDTSLRTLKSWGLWLGSYIPYSLIQSFGWGAQLVLWGVIPLEVMFITRSAFNIVWYFFFIWLYPPLTAILHSLTVKYRLHWNLMSPQPYTRFPEGLPKAS